MSCNVVPERGSRVSLGFITLVRRLLTDKHRVYYIIVANFRPFSPAYTRVYGVQYSRWVNQIRRKYETLILPCKLHINNSNMLGINGLQICPEIIFMRKYLTSHIAFSV